MFSPSRDRSSKPSPLSYTTPTGSPTRQFRRGDIQFTSQSLSQSPTSSTTSTLHAPRSASGPVNQLSQPQIAEIRESFQIYDKDGDGIINREDLTAMLNSLGQEPTPQMITQYFSSVPTPFSLAAYLTTLTTHLSQLSPREDLLTAFAAFDDNDSGLVDIEALKEAMGDMGMRGDEVERACKSFSQRKGLGQTGGDKFRYREFVDTVSGKPLENAEA